MDILTVVFTAVQLVSTITSFFQDTLVRLTNAGDTLGGLKASMDSVSASVTDVNVQLTTLWVRRALEKDPGWRRSCKSTMDTITNLYTKIDAAIRKSDGTRTSIEKKLRDASESKQTSHFATALERQRNNLNDLKNSPPLYVTTPKPQSSESRSHSYAEFRYSKALPGAQVCAIAEYTPPLESRRTHHWLKRDDYFLRVDSDIGDWVLAWKYNEIGELESAEKLIPMSYVRYYFPALKV
jgi:hypothetical protein